MLTQLASPSRTSVVHPGDRVEGRYHILDVIAAGGMGTVFLAEHTLIKRRVAVKVLHPELAADEGMIRRFMNEASAAGTLGHPNIVESTDMGFTPERVPFIVFEYLDGTLLTHEIYQHHVLPVRRTLNIAMQIASALEAAHRAGIVHLDLKSDNIFLVAKRDGLDHVKVIDFGISKFLEGDVDPDQRNLIMGTPEFMSPEQITVPEQVDARADIYALGVVLYEMLAARRPYSDDEARLVLHRIVYEATPPLGRKNVPAELESMILERMLAKDPDARFSSMAEVGAALAALDEKLRTGDSLPEIPVPAVVHDPSIALPVAPRPRWPIALFVIAMLAGLGGGGLLYAERRMRAALDADSAGALETDAAQLSRVFETTLQSVRVRTAEMATDPVVRVAITKKPAAIARLTVDGQPWTPGSAEVLQLYKVVNGQPVPVLRVPAGAQAIQAVPAPGTAMLAIDGKKLTVIATAPIVTPAGGIGGLITIATPIELGQVRGRLGGDALQATLLGLATPIELLAPSEPNVNGVEEIVPVAIPSELASGPVILHAVVKPMSRGKTLRMARQASWGFGALMLLSFVGIGALRSRR